MGSLTVRLLVRVLFGDGEIELELAADQSETLAASLTRIHVDAHLSGMPTDWQFLRDGKPVPVDAELGDLADPSGTVSLVLSPAGEAANEDPPARPSRASLPAVPDRPSRRMRAEPLLSDPEWVPAFEPFAPDFGNGEDSDEESLEGIREQKKTYSSSRLRVLPPGERRAVVRYSDRMHVGRPYPVTVVLSKHQVKEARRAGPVELEVEPVFPGCRCHPMRETLRLEDQPVAAAFDVTPDEHGRVAGARVVIRQGGRVVADVPLAAVVERAVPARAIGLPGLALILPEFAAQMHPAAEAALTAWAGGRMAVALMAVAGTGLLCGALVYHARTKPREANVFWEVASLPE